MLIKNMMRKIKKSLGRYLSIFFIVFVGVGFLAGIQAASNDIRNSLQTYYEKQKLMDLKIEAQTGFDENDKNQIRKMDGVKNVTLTHVADVLDEKGKVLRFHAIQKNMNKVTLVKGTLPVKDTDVLADARLYKVGDKITIESDVTGILKNTKYTVSGTIKTPLYVGETYGSTTKGDGTLYSYLYVKDENFTLPVYTQMDVLLNQSKDDLFYKDSYKELVKSAKHSIEDYSNSNDKNWYVSERDTFAGYKELEDSTFMIDKVAVVLPVFFILIVILMTSNTMARMIFEERLEMGTMLSLGYHTLPITMTYIGYVLSATILASALGFFAGSMTIPDVIYQTFQKFVMPPLEESFYMEQFVILMSVAIILMSVVTIFFCAIELRLIPARLLRPVPPKKGQKILLERIGFLWKHLNFTWKVTIRNMFRYKQRVFMMIVGVSGCMALLVTGFGLKESISGVTQKQFGQIFKYDALITLKQEVTDLDKDFSKNLTSYHLKTPLLVNQSQIQAKKAGKSYDIYMVVSADNALFQSYYHLTDLSTKDSVSLKEKGLILTKRIAKKLNVTKGDSITITNAQKEKRTIKINAVVDNYIGNYAYLSKEAYEKAFDETISYNVIVTKADDINEKTLTKQLKQEENVLNISYKSDIINQAKAGFSNLDGVIVLIVAVAVVLSFIVLYNLTSINLSERKREIATLKVLGFTETEANSYIYREAFFLSVLSIVVGLFLGKLMHLFVIQTIQGDSTSYLLTLSWKSYALPALILLAVTIAMQFVTFRKIQTIDMIDSLKSVE